MWKPLKTRNFFHQQNNFALFDDKNCGKENNNALYSVFFWGGGVLNISENELQYTEQIIFLDLMIITFFGLPFLTTYKFQEQNIPLIMFKLIFFSLPFDSTNCARRIAWELHYVLSLSIISVNVYAAR